jgi:hypothetical protein
MMFGMVHDRVTTGLFGRLLYCDVEGKWGNYQIITLSREFLFVNKENVLP